MAAMSADLTTLSAVELGDDEPFPLKEACQRFFGGKISPATLRAEWRRGRLEIERIGRQDFVTPRGIREMRAKCRAKPSPSASGSGQPSTEMGSSSNELSGASKTVDIESSLAAARMTAAALKQS